MTVRELIILGCSSQQPTRLRNHGAYLLRWNGEGLLFDPGEGTQRQFIFANVPPPCVTRIFVSHFHGDHCLGLGSMLMRLNLDKVVHPIHCYYPGSGRRYFERLRGGSIYHETIQIVEHPIYEEGVIEDGEFKIEAYFLEHGVDTLGWRVQERAERKFDQAKLLARGLKGAIIKELASQGEVAGVSLDEVSYLRQGDIFGYIADTLPCSGTLKIAKNATMLLCESTYLTMHEDVAKNHRHLTAAQAATIAQSAGAQSLILTHFSARYQDLTEFAQEAGAIFPATSIAEDLRVFPFPKSHRPAT
jgi:ribonuclease Z